MYLGFVVALLLRWLAKEKAWPNLVDAAEAIENRSKLHAELRSELRVAASFAEKSQPTEFELAHLRRVSEMLSNFKKRVWPSPQLLLSIGFAFILVTSLVQMKMFQLPVPESLEAWSPRSYQARAPFPGATWQEFSGAISAVRGSRIKVPVDTFILQKFVFIKTSKGDWRAIVCRNDCEWSLEDSGQYAIGSLFSRSSFFPLVALEDDPPKSALLAEVNSEFVSVVGLEIEDAKSLSLELTASDDLRLKKIDFVHLANEKEEILKSWELHDKFFKEKLSISLEGWQGGSHELFIRPSDDHQSSESLHLRIVFNDENSKREKRVQQLGQLLDEWTHVLADLIDSKLENRLPVELVDRLKSIEYPEIKENGVLLAYVKELQLLAQRLQVWIERGGPLKNVDDLIARTERQLLYGISLLFEEKAGDLQQAGESLADSQKDLSSLLEKLKEGKLDLNSKALEEAFKKLAEKLKELQEKISSLPNGPQDEMINREALQQQADESADLQKRIDEIRNQAAAGDEKGALKEMESLLNQLNILTKEMERGLNQWQENRDQGTPKQAQEFAKKLEDLKKREEELNQKNDEAKSKIEELEKENPYIWKPKDAEALKKLQGEVKKLEKEQQEISQKFDEAAKEFDQGLEGTEWKSLFRNGESLERESQIREGMQNSKENLGERRLFESGAQQKEVIDLIKKEMESQKQKMEQMQQMSQPSSAPDRRSQRIEIMGNEAKGDQEKRKRIMESLRQRVGDKYQGSHERYFEELLQR